MHSEYVIILILIFVIDYILLFITLIIIIVRYTYNVFNFIEKKFPDIPLPPKYTFWFEVSALVAFGISWLVKGGFVMTDEGQDSTLKQVSHMMKLKR